MKYKSILLAIFSFSFFFNAQSQARLTIENNSKRSMTIKVMNGNNTSNNLYETVYIESFQNKTIYFNQSGNYFTKSKAVLGGRDPVFQKGQPFYITNNSSGYSIMTLTFSITESSVPQMSGKQISKSEFDKN